MKIVWITTRPWLAVAVLLLGGVDSHKNGIGNLREAMPREHLGKPVYLGSLATHVVTVSELLQGTGYRTYITGKWNVGSEPHNLPHRPTVDWFEDGKAAVMPKDYCSSAYFVDRMLEYIRSGSGSGKPFFAYLGFQANHVPVQAPQSFIDKYKGRYKDGWTALRQARRDRAAELGLIPKGARMVTMSTTVDWNSLSDKERRLAARQMEVYAAMAEAMDHHVGRLVSHLKQTGEFGSSVLVFLSDNGAKHTYGIPGPGWASASVSPLSA